GDRNQKPSGRPGGHPHPSPKFQSPTGSSFEPSSGGRIAVSPSLLGSACARYWSAGRLAPTFAHVFIPRPSRRDIAALGTINRVTIGMELREPLAILRVAAHAWLKIDISCLSRLGVRAPDLPLVQIVVEAVHVVVEVGGESVSGNVA